MLRYACALALLPAAHGWNDIAGALTYKGTSHVFQVREPPRLALLLHLELTARALLGLRLLPLPLTGAPRCHTTEGCPGGGQPGSSAHGWHHAATTDLVHWEDRGIHVEAIAEKYEGFTSNTSPCSGFVTVDDEGCAAC